MVMGNSALSFSLYVCGYIYIYIQPQTQTEAFANVFSCNAQSDALMPVTKATPVR